MGKKHKLEEAVEEEDVVDSDEEYELEKAALAELQPDVSKALAINNIPGLEQSLRNFKKDLPWIESLCVDTAESATEKIENVHDDLKRELTFYELTIKGAKEAQKRILSLGLPLWRPTDYYCEMIKDDEHMSKIKKKLMEEQKNAAVAETRRKEREARKFGKQLQIQKKQEKDKAKRDALDSIKKWKNDKGESKIPLEMDDFSEKKRDEAAPKKRDEAAAPKKRDTTPKKNHRRDFKNKKYSVNARAKKDAKMNTKESARKLTGFSIKKNKAPPKGVRKFPKVQSTIKKRNRGNRKQ